MNDDRFYMLMIFVFIGCLLSIMSGAVIENIQNPQSLPLIAKLALITPPTITFILALILGYGILKEVNDQ